MKAWGFVRLIVTAILVYCGPMAAQTEDAAEPLAVMEFGGSVERSFSFHESSYGPTVAVESTLSERWLEVEAGVTPLFGHHSTEWGTDLIFKKPWTLSSKAEFMLGVGPEWIHSNARGSPANAGAIEIVPDFMFWPKGQHRFGWYLEPSYEFKLGPHHEHSIAIAGGLLIGIGKRR